MCGLMQREDENCGSTVMGQCMSAETREYSMLSLFWHAGYWLVVGGYQVLGGG